LALTNTIVAGNTATHGPDINGTIDASSKNNLIGNGAGSTGISNGSQGNLVGTTAAPIDPKLAPLGSYGGPTQTFALRLGSPATDAGDDATCNATGTGTVNKVDQRGTARPQGAHCDIGAFESRGFTLTATSGTNQSTPINIAFVQPLQATLAAVDTGVPTDGVSITFVPPASGASATLTGNPATTNASGIASVTATATATVGGPYTVTANVTGTPLTTAATFSLTNQHGPVTQITVTGIANGATVKVGQTVQLTATALFQGGGTQDVTSQVTWSSSDPNIASVDSTGKVTFKAPGTVTITATLTTANGASSQATVTGSVTVVVGSGTPIGVAPAPAPGSRPGSAGTTPAPTAPHPAPAPRSGG
jgi:uncharacterized protein YjdB